MGSLLVGHEFNEYMMNTYIRERDQVRCVAGEIESSSVVTWSLPAGFGLAFAQLLPFSSFVL